MKGLPAHYFVVLLGVLCLAAQPVMAQVQRDPTIAPFDTGRTVGGGATATPPAAVGANVITRDAVPYLVVGTRLVAVGQRVESATLERITETEIWLREGRSLKKLARFEGIQRSVAATSDCVSKELAPKSRLSERTKPTQSGVKSSPRGHATVLCGPAKQ